MGPHQLLLLAAAACCCCLLLLLPPPPPLLLLLLLMLLLPRRRWHTLREKQSRGSLVHAASGAPQRCSVNFCERSCFFFALIKARGRHLPSLPIHLPSPNATMSTHIDKDEPNDANKNFKVVIRVRPPLPRELDGDKRFQNIVRLDSSRQIRVSENLAALDDPYSDEAISTNFSTYTFTFDHVYGEDNDQKSVYENTAREAVMSTLQGYNATIIAYGQTGTGKTYTMEGEPTKQKRGLIPRATEEIFRHIEGSASEKKKFLVRASYLQIYNEVISDLLKPDRTNLHIRYALFVCIFLFEPDTLLRIREDKRKGVYVEGLSEWVVRSPKEVYGLMQRGASTRATAPTKMNEISSRSHAVFIIILEQLEYVEEADKGAAAPEADGGGDMAQVFKVGKLNLVDLAGSERVRLTGATGQRLEESRKINQSLSALGNVIAALTTSGRQHIPYRDSKLTRILEDSLGGNCKTTMMAMISPALEAYVESLSTLKFANRAKNIKNEAHVNEDLDQKALLRKYEKEIKKLRSELEQKTKTVGDKRRLLQLQHQKEQAEKDKESVLIQLQLQSEEFMRAKEDKERLEQRLSLMESQLLEGGSQQHADAEAFQRALQKEQKRLQHEYDERVAKLEAQGGGGVKNILEQQRQVLTKLTERLRKRDECIARLQDELDA